MLLHKNDKTEASLFGGGQGAGVGARRAGYRSLWSVEYDQKIADVATANGFNMIVADVCAVDYSALQRPYWLHMSPVCTRASNANAKATENDLDISTAKACCRAITMLQPRRISLENVWGYRNFAAFRLICATLKDEGYAFDYWHLNAADYGVPQTRRRLALVASKDHQPRRPVPTHYNDKEAPISMLYRPWVSWYDAIADLIPDLPDSAFAEWQLKLLPADLRQSVLVNTDTKMGICEIEKPCFTLVSSPRIKDIKTFIVDGQPGSHGTELTIRDQAEPMYTILSSANKKPARAFVGRVVKMTPRALARFNGLEDTYILPKSNTLACTVIGNMHMPGIQHAIMEANG